MSTLRENLFDLFHLDQMQKEKAIETVERLSNLVFQAVLVRVLPTLSENDLEEYEKIVDSDKGGDELFKFLNEKVPGFEDIVKEESENLFSEMNTEFTAAGI